MAKVWWFGVALFGRSHLALFEVGRGEGGTALPTYWPMVEILRGIDHDPNPLQDHIYIVNVIGISRAMFSLVVGLLGAHLTQFVAPVLMSREDETGTAP